MLHHYNYCCPFCDHTLTANGEISFLTFDKLNRRINLKLSAIPGKYGYRSEPKIHLNTGDRLDFICPHCESNLHSYKYPKFVEIYLVVSEGITFEVLFSPVCGEKITYVIMEDEMVKYRSDFFSLISHQRKAS